MGDSIVANNILTNNMNIKNINRGGNLNIELVKYENKYAKGVAKMWVDSAEAWGGQILNSSAESVISKEGNSPHLELMLAKDVEEIVGYCKLSVDHTDEGALYIDYLNVRPDYHGKSIGKRLILDTIEKTIARGWRRLDLSTWPGNTKAVPLYKKCGFFWEKRENTTHLINLIPDVLKCDLVSEYFETADWYKDSTREIKQEPDSRIVNGFDLWNYKWEKDGKKLNMEYSRRGRGLRKIENDDFIIEVVVENMKLISGSEYKVKYLFKNKTDKTLYINIDGEDDKNIRYNFTTSFELVDTKEIETTFFVDKITKKQEEQKTHPVVKSIIKVNDKKATFMTGIEPVFPLSVDFKYEKNLSKLDVETDCYIDIENQCSETTTFSFEIPSSDSFKLSKSEFEITLDAKAKHSIKTSYILNEACIYSKHIRVKAKRENLEDFIFEKPLDLVLQADYGRLSGESEKKYIMANGRYKVELLKDNNELVVTEGKSGNYYEVEAPRLGKPFSQEFEQKKASRVEFESKNDWIKMIIFYESDESTGIRFKRIVKLHSNGVVKRSYELTNNGSSDKELSISESMYLDANNMIAPYNNKFISLENESTSHADILDGGKFTENWLYTQTETYTYGMIWPKDIAVIIADNAFVNEKDFGTLKSGETKLSSEFIVGAGSYSDWHDLREYATGKTLEREELVLATEVLVNNGNPFVTESVEVTLKEHKDVSSKGELSVTLNSTDNKMLLSENECKLSFNMKNNMELVDLAYSLETDSLSYKKLILKKGNVEIEKNISKENKLDVYSIDNGIVKFKCAPDFSASIFSLEHDNKEWLNTSFPKPRPHSWWNSWLGGINWRPMDIDLETMLDEENSCEFVEKTDSVGNVWQGLVLETVIRESEVHKGITWKQYYLTLEGTPVVAHFVEFKNTTNEYTKRKMFQNQVFFDYSENRSHFTYSDKNNRNVKIKKSKESRMHKCDYNFEYKQNANENLLKMYSNLETSMRGFFLGTEEFGTWGFDWISTESNKEKSNRPSFMIFAKDKIKDEWLRDFKNIRF